MSAEKPAPKKTTISLAKTPVQRALANTKRSTLLLLFVVGILAGFFCKAYFKDPAPAANTPAAATQPR